MRCCTIFGILLGSQAYLKLVMSMTGISLMFLDCFAVARVSKPLLLIWAKLLQIAWAFLQMPNMIWKLPMS